VAITLEQHLAQSKQMWTELSQLDPEIVGVFLESQNQNNLPMLQSMLQKIDEELAKRKKKQWKRRRKTKKTSSRKRRR
jgi:predicted house-cleaning noncanonical NTP pyrophosphatase (MazG superfamily)